MRNPYSAKFNGICRDLGRRMTHETTHRRTHDILSRHTKRYATYEMSRDNWLQKCSIIVLSWTTTLPRKYQMLFHVVVHRIKMPCVVSFAVSKCVLFGVSSFKSCFALKDSWYKARQCYATYIIAFKCIVSFLLISPRNI